MPSNSLPPCQRMSQPLADLPGIAPSAVKQLAQLGLHTTAQLLRETQHSRQQQVLAHQLGLSQRFILKWRALAELAQVPSVGCQYSGLLLHAGIAAVDQLAATSLGNLHGRLKRLHVATLRRTDLCPPPNQVAQWIQEARLLTQG